MLQSYRYKMIVEVETPQGIRNGSGVIEVRARRSIGFPGPEAGGVIQKFRGEAIPIDLGDGRTLYALLNSPLGLGAAGVVHGAFKDQVKYIGNREKSTDVLATERLRGEVSEKYYPWVVYFTDPSNPNTARAVSPASRKHSNDRDIRVARIIIETTDEPVTTGRIEERLPWLETLGPRMLDGSRSSHRRTVANSLMKSDFVDDGRLF